MSDEWLEPSDHDIKKHGLYTNSVEKKENTRERITKFLRRYENEMANETRWKFNDDLQEDKKRDSSDS